jgi:hypothetical protein
MCEARVGDPSEILLFDKGAFRVSRPVGPLDSVSEVDGAALEGSLLSTCALGVATRKKTLVISLANTFSQRGRFYCLRRGRPYLPSKSQMPIASMAMSCGI